MCALGGNGWWALGIYSFWSLTSDKWNLAITLENVSQFHTAHQLYGITLRVRPSGFIAGDNLCQCQYKAPENIFKDPRNHLTKNYGLLLLLSSPVLLSFSGVLISQIAPKAVWRICVDHIQLWAIAVCKLPLQTKVAIMPTDFRLVIIETIGRFSGHGLSHRGMGRITRVLHGSI